MMTMTTNVLRGTIKVGRSPKPGMVLTIKPAAIPNWTRSISFGKMTMRINFFPANILNLHEIKVPSSKYFYIFINAIKCAISKSLNLALNYRNI